MKVKNIVPLMLLLSAQGFAQQPMNLDDFLLQVQKRNRAFEAYDASLEAARDSQAAGDLALSPVLTASGRYVNDKALSPSNTTIIPEKTQVKSYTLGIAKTFSSGTNVAINTNLNQLDATGIVNPGSTAFATSQSYGGAGVSISQSLWKNFFGHSTRLRWEREAALRQRNITGVSIARKRTLIDAEALFWNHVYNVRELEVRKSGLERSRKIESWVSRRVNNGIGDSADLYNAQSLRASRELQLLIAEDELIASEKSIRDLLELGPEEKLPSFEAPLKSERKLIQYVDNATEKANSSDKIMSVDAYINSLDAEAKRVVADEAKDSLRPDLVLEGSYTTNNYGTDMDSLKSKLTEKDRPTQSIGVRFSWLLDWDTKNQVRNAALKDALAAKLNQERSFREGQTSWAEIQRRHAELSKKIKAAEIVSRLQSSRAAAERDKLSKGRSITSQVVEAEQFADEAELNLTKLLVEQRKLESQARLFVKVEGNI